MSAPVEPPRELFRWPQPGELWSVWDMVEIKLRDLLEATQRIAQMRQSFIVLEDSAKAGMMNVEALGAVMGAADYIIKFAKEADLDATLACAERLHDNVVALKLTHLETGRIPAWIEAIRELELHVASTHQAIKDQLRARNALMLSAPESRLFAPTEPPFGADFAARFHAAEYDVAEAAKCLALERSTAAAFHCMRVAELGVRALAKCVGIPDPTKPAEKNWGMVLAAIKKDGLDVKWPKAADRMSGDGAEMEALYASLDAMKNPWRNGTMHVERTYQPYEAREVFDATRSFMQRLAKRMDQDGNPKA